MNDIEKIHRLLAFKEAFNPSKEDIEKYTKQISSSELISRFEKGLKIENSYRKLFESMPFVKELTKLGEEQTTEQKQNYQIPDYKLSVSKSNDIDCFSLYVDVKSVKQEKTTLEIQRKQKIGLEAYSKMNNTPIVIAIYWSKFNYWTHNSFSAFKKKQSRLHITFEEAIKNDISCILGDFMCLNDGKPLYRQTFFGETDKNVVKDVRVSKDNKNFEKIEVVEDAALNIITNFKKIEKNKYFILEQSNGFFSFKLSFWLSSFFKSLEISDFSEEANGITYGKYGVQIILLVFKKMNMKRVFSLPNVTCNVTNTLYKYAFEGSSIYSSYLNICH